MLGKNVTQLLAICRKTKFLESTFKDQIVSNLKYSPLYELLKKNIVREWQTSRDPKISNLAVESNASDGFNCYNQEYFIENFRKMKEKETLPFSITEILHVPLEFSKNCDEDLIKVSPAIPVFLRTSYFVREKQSKESLYQIQRQHKIRWMKYSVNPQKYSISDQKVRDSINTLSLHSSWDFSGKLEIERINFFPMKSFLDSQNFPVYEFDRKKEIPWIVQSITCLETAALNIVMDSLTHSEDVFKFHRRLAPYQVSIFKIGDQDNDLQDLARFIELLIAREDSNIQILNKSDEIIKDNQELNRQFKYLDETIGIPYSIILDRNSLAKGLLKLRNRNTTLSETIHISDVPEYVVKIYNSI